MSSLLWSTDSPTPISFFLVPQKNNKGLGDTTKKDKTEPIKLSVPFSSPVTKKTLFVCSVMSDVKRSLLDMSPGGKTDDADEEPEEHVESNETFAEFCTRESLYLFMSSALKRSPNYPF